ncbi:hypothetical protein AGMMS49579_08360 [Spirochaetia bacterium]|nr:hypothetical protein AGMMS49579_08360 [Spirochaetia bacterium]
MDYLQQLTQRYPALSSVSGDIQRACELLIDVYKKKGKLLIAGNGGSAADAEHISGELMKGFVKKRCPPPEFIAKLRMTDPGAADYLGSFLQRGLSVIPLTLNPALSTACINDIDGGIIFAQQVYGYGQSGDAFLGISTSGNAKNVINAAITARTMGLKTIALSGGSGGELKKFSDVSIIVPEKETYKIQELHIPVYHTICLILEDYFF